MKGITAKKIRSVTVLVIIEGIILLLFLISVTGNYFITKKNADNRSLQIVQSGYDELIENLNNDLKNVAKAGYTLLSSGPIERLKIYYYDLIDKDSYERNTAINSVTEQMISIVSYYDALDACAVWIKPYSEELYYNTMYSFVGDDTKKELLDYIITKHEYSAEYTGALMNYNGHLLLTISTYYNDGAIAAFILDSEYLLNSLKLASIPNAKLSLEVLNGKLSVVCTSEDGINKVKDYKEPMEKAQIKGGSIIYYTEIANCLPLYVEIDTAKIDGLNVYMIFALCALLLLFFASLATLIIFNVYFNKPIKTMLTAMEEVGKGNFDVIIDQKIGTDFQNLYDGFNSMVGEINGYVEENYRQQVMRTESEFKALQAQINPHFLYNCFANIRNLCKMGDLETVELMTGKLSKLFLYITRSSEPIVCLAEEYENMLDYLAVQQVRFGERVVVECSPLCHEYANLKIPKLCLQPIVENAYKYVFSNIEENGLLKISYEEKGEVLVISIEDNGTISKEQISALNESVRDKSGVVTGLINVSRRLNHYAGDKERFKISQSSLGGLCVQIILDLKSGE